MSLARRFRFECLNSSQRGMAIIGALVLVAVVAVISSALLERQALLAQTLETDRDRSQARWILRGGLDWARLILLNDARANSVTRSEAAWAQPITGLPLELPGTRMQAMFSGHIEDEQGKFNVMTLLGRDPNRNKADALQVLEKLLGLLGLPVTGARQVAQSLESHHAQQGGSPFVTAGLRSVDELRRQIDLSDEQWQSLRPYLTLLPPSTTINVNSASAPVLSAAVPGLDLVRARELVNDRARGQWFTSTADFLSRAGLSRPPEGMQLGVNSEWFKVNGTVTLEHARMSMQALLLRAGPHLPVIRWVIY